MFCTVANNTLRTLLFVPSLRTVVQYSVSGWHSWRSPLNNLKVLDPSSTSGMTSSCQNKLSILEPGLVVGFILTRNAVCVPFDILFTWLTVFNIPCKTIFVETGSLTQWVIIKFKFHTQRIHVILTPWCRVHEMNIHMYMFLIEPEHCFMLYISHTLYVHVCKRINFWHDKLYTCT